MSQVIQCQECFDEFNSFVCLRPAHSTFPKEGERFTNEQFNEKLRQSGTLIVSGIYQHFKGGEYQVVSAAKNSETEEDVVVYASLSNPSEIWVRPRKMFFEVVQIDGVLGKKVGQVPRFKFFRQGEDEKFRQLNEMYHINSKLELVKSSNSMPVPEDEPLFILRGRDNLALSAIRAYISFCVADRVDQDRIKALRKVAGRFAQFAEENADVMKQPGITKGK